MCSNNNNNKNNNNTTTIIITTTTTTTTIDFLVLSDLYLLFNLMSIIVFFSNSSLFISLPFVSDPDKERKTREEKRERELLDLQEETNPPLLLCRLTMDTTLFDDHCH